MTQALKLTERPNHNQAEQLDHEIDDAMRSFVELGMKLIEMRDSGLYRQLPNPFKEGENFETFEEYAAAKGEIGRTHAKRLIRSSLTQRALVDGSPNLGPPKIESQARVLADNVVEFETREESNPHGGVVRYPIGVANPDELRTVWSKVADKYERIHTKDPRRKLSASFIYDNLPRQYQRGANPKVQIKDPRMIGRMQRNGQKFLDLIGYPDPWDLDEVKDMAEKETWSANDLAGLRNVLKDVEDYVADFRSILSGYRLPR